MSVIKKSDYRVTSIKTSAVYVSAASKNDKDIKTRSSNVAVLAAAAYQILRDEKLLVLSDDVIIRVAKTKKVNNKGAYYPEAKVVEVDPRWCYESIMQTICHELVHSEQYYEGRLKWEGNTQFWNDIPSRNKGTTYNTYRQMPWEVEAFSRQDSLAEQVWQKLIALNVISLEWYQTYIGQ